MKRCLAVRTLIIDDDETLCRRLVGWLGEASYDVAWFTQATLGLQHASGEALALAIIDLRLPDADGVQVVAAISSLQPRARIVGMSAFPDEPLIQAAFAAGARDVLCKPIDQATLLATLAHQMAEAGVNYRTEPEFNARLGARLRGLRVSLRRSVTEVARSSGISTAQLSQIELGRNAASTWTLARISHTLNVPLADLFREA